MTLEFHEPAGATPLTPDELLGLKAKHIATRGELNELEGENIITGLTWHITDFVPRGTGADQGFDMQHDAGLAAGGDGNAEGHKFLGFEFQHTTFLDGLAQSAEGPRGIGDGFVEGAQLVAGAVELGVPGHDRSFAKY
tara:strand:+ start:1693 stop:2106 length:414 start_codon:yes stop_codon:yes gene_type:complete